MGDKTQVSTQPEHPLIATPGGGAPAGGPTGRRVRWAWCALAAALAPALAAIWSVAYFVTQDGPAHLYNAQILVWSFDASSPFRDVFTVHWQPIPNWAGHLVLAGLMAVFPAWVADRVIMSLTLAGFAASILWLRWRVAGERGMVPAALLAALLGMNLAWILGFTSFLLGACLFPVTLGFWWPNRDRLDARRLLALTALLILGYFSHVVSVGLTVLALVVLSLVSPAAFGNASSWQRKLSRLARTSLTFIPLVLLGISYLRMSRSSGPMSPSWETLVNPYSPADWGERVGWVDPVTLAIKDGVPFTDLSGKLFVFLAPAVWLAVALVLWWYGRITAPARAVAADTAPFPIDRDGTGQHLESGRGDRRAGWLLLAALLLLGGIAGPDSFGAAHGEFLPQRLVLLGLTTLVPVFDLDASRRVGRAAIGALAIAVGLQSAIVWDYALYSDSSAGQIIRAGPAVGRFQRIATLLVSTRSRFRTNPLLHAENWLGVDTGNVVWNNYEATHYYFPVHFHDGIDRPSPADLEYTSIHDDPKTAASRASGWEKILERHARSIDVLLVWKSEPALDAVTARYFDGAERLGDLRIFRNARGPALPENSVPGLFVSPRDQNKPRESVSRGVLPEPRLSNNTRG
jgi:hypothetical protein